MGGMPRHPPTLTLLMRSFPLNCFRWLETRVGIGSIEV